VETGPQLFDVVMGFLETPREWLFEGVALIITACPRKEFLYMAMRTSLPLNGKGIDFIHHQQIEIMGVTVKLMGRENDEVIAFKRERVLPINRGDPVLRESLLETPIELNHDIAPGQRTETAFP
jgi:hypothetical protein